MTLPVIVKRLFRRSGTTSPAVSARITSPDTIVPRGLGPVGQATSDSAYLVLEAISAVQGAPAAADIAVGYADAFARFALRHPNAFD